MPTAVQTEEPQSKVLSQEPAPNRARRRPIWPFGISSRLRILRRFRHLLAANATALADAIPATLPRNRADSLAAEVLPLLAAIKFLERDAKAILAPRRLGKRGLPFWLTGLDTTIERVPLGSILILAPYNYPLLLPGVQAVQAIVAGNTVVWKPGRGGKPVADFFATLFAEAGRAEGLHEEILRVTEDTTEAAQAELALRPAKILFTGSAATGRAILHAAAETLTPVTAELSGCDAVFVLPTADPHLVAHALLFGMRLNGSQTCMAPRRLILVDTPPPSYDLLRRRSDLDSPQSLGAPLIAPSAMSGTYEAGPLHPTHQTLLALLQEGLPTLPRVSNLPPIDLLNQATQLGATVIGTHGQPYLILNATPEMAITRSDVFYPVLSVLRAASPEHAVVLHAASKLSLTAAIFGTGTIPDWLATRLNSPTILINDLIVPTADPRIPFGGLGDSGFGTTRGREGLLELTSAKTTSTRRNRNYRHFHPTTPAHESLFTGLIELTHAGTWAQRYAGLRKLIIAAKSLK